MTTQFRDLFQVIGFLRSCIACGEDLSEEVQEKIDATIAAARSHPLPVPASPSRPRVALETPYSGDVERNLRYARACMHDSISRGEAPIASHLLYTQPGILDDEVQEERELGIECGLIWNGLAGKTVVYEDLGISGGMRQGITDAETAGRAIEYRKIGMEWDTPAQGAPAPAPAADALEGVESAAYETIKDFIKWASYGDKAKDLAYKALEVLFRASVPSSTPATAPAITESALWEENNRLLARIRQLEKATPTVPSQGAAPEWKGLGDWIDRAQAVVAAPEASPDTPVPPVNLLSLFPQEASPREAGGLDLTIGEEQLESDYEHVKSEIYLGDKPATEALDRIATLAKRALKSKGPEGDGRGPLREAVGTIEKAILYLEAEIVSPHFACLGIQTVVREYLKPALALLQSGDASAEPSTSSPSPETSKGE